MLEKIMKSLSLFIAVSMLLHLAANAQSMEKFQPKLQIANTLSIDKLREQNLNVVRKAVEGIRENLPQQVDAYTKLVDVESNGTTLIYIFEVKAGVKTDTALKEEGAQMVPRIREGICLSSKRFLEADISLRYQYISSTTKTEVLRVDVNKTQCQTRSPRR